MVPVAEAVRVAVLLDMVTTLDQSTTWYWEWWVVGVAIAVSIVVVR